MHKVNSAILVSSQARASATLICTEKPAHSSNFRYLTPFGSSLNELINVKLAMLTSHEQFLEKKLSALEWVFLFQLLRSPLRALFCGFFFHLRITLTLFACLLEPKMRENCQILRISFFILGLSSLYSLKYLFTAENIHNPVQKGGKLLSSSASFSWFRNENVVRMKNCN